MRATIIFFLSFCFSAFLWAQNPEMDFEKANTAYNEGDFSTAITLYEGILKQEKHAAALYFNLANPYYKQGAVAESIFYYEKAKQLAPKDASILNNSQFAQNMALDAIEILPTTQLQSIQNHILELLNVSQWSYFVVILAWGIFLFFVLYQINTRSILKRLFFVLGSLSILLLLVTYGFLQVKLSDMAKKSGILFNKEEQVWSEPNNRSELLFLLHEGTKVEILDELQGWTKIKLANGSEGWMLAEGIKSLQDPLRE